MSPAPSGAAPTPKAYIGLAHVLVEGASDVPLGAPRRRRRVGVLAVRSVRWLPRSLINKGAPSSEEVGRRRTLASVEHPYLRVGGTARWRWRTTQIDS
jgi:hypothetical protein